MIFNKHKRPADSEKPKSKKETSDAKRGPKKRRDEPEAPRVDLESDDDAREEQTRQDVSTRF